MQTARMLAMAHVAGGDAMIVCFDAKYHYWFWRPYQAINSVDADNNPETFADPTWQPRRAYRTRPESAPTIDFTTSSRTSTGRASSSASKWHEGKELFL